ncbi:MAG: GDSL-type esterase/lipase family protein [Patescibacteria group bacterium]
MNFLEEIEKEAIQDKLYPIAFYGASTTSSEYVFPNWVEIIRYVLKDAIEQKLGDYKKAYWNIQTFNLGLDGASSKDLLEKFDDLVLRINPRLLFLAMGKNDPYYGIDPKETAENTFKLISKALDSGIKVIFANTPPALWESLNEKIKNHLQAEREVAKKFAENGNFMFIDIFEKFPKEELEKIYTLISADGNKVVGIKPGEVDPIHYNKRGSALVAKIFLKEAFDIDFNVENFLQDLNDPTKKYPSY